MSLIRECRCGHDRASHHFDARGPGDCLARGCSCKAYDERKLSRATVALSMMLSACASWSTTGSLWRGAGPNDCPVHVGARPASDGIGDYAATLQVSGDIGPWCERTDGGHP